MSNRKYLRAILSTLIAVLIAISGIALSLGFSMKLGWGNDKVLKSELADKSYVSKSISEMKSKIEAIVMGGLPNAAGFDELLDEDALYTAFYNAEQDALSGKSYNETEIESFRSKLTAFYDKNLDGVYRTKIVEENISSAIEESVRIYENYMHPKFFNKFHDIQTKLESLAYTLMISAVIVMAVGMVLLRKMYHYKRHAFPYAVGGLIASVLGNLIYIMAAIKSTWTASSGISPECYKSLALSMTQYGGYVGLIVTGIEVIGICFMTYFIKRAKKH